jgi:hypothetical protein
LIAAVANGGKDCFAEFQKELTAKKTAIDLASAGHIILI